MPFTHTLTHITKHDNGLGIVETLIQTDAQTGKEELNFSAIVVASESLSWANFALDISQVKALMIWAAGGLGMTLKTNSASTPTDTLVLVENEPVVWSPGLNSATNPITADITSLHAVGGGGDCTLKIKALIDTAEV